MNNTMVSGKKALTNKKAELFQRYGINVLKKDPTCWHLDEEYKL